MLFAGLAMLGACSLFSPQLDEEAGGGAAVELTGVPFFPQTDYQSGPAALATVLAAQGIPAAPEQLLREVYVSGRDDSLAPGITSATRARGLVAYVFHDRIALIREVRSGRPVIVQQNLGSSSSPRWHFAVVVGVDPSRDVFVLRSGTDARLAMSYGDFIDAWHDGGNWAMVVARPEEIPLTASVQSWFAAVQPFEAAHRPEIAERAYSAASQRWPTDVLVWESLANARHAREDFIGASMGFAKALEISPQETIARNNLAYVLLERRCAEQAEAQIDLALAAETDPAQAAIFRRTRAMILNYTGPSITCPGI